MEKEIKMKTCPACNTEFECVHSIDCWCMKYSISKSKKEYLAVHYKDCLCEKCLIKFVDFKEDARSWFL